MGEVKGWLLRKKNIPVIIITGILLFLLSGLIYRLCSPVFFRLDQLYLGFSEKLAILLDRWWGLTAVSLDGHKVLYGGREVPGFVTETLFKKWNIFLIIFFWVTRTSWQRKVSWTIGMLTISFFLVTLHNATGVYFVVRGYYVDRFYAFSLTLGMLIMASIGYLWYRLNKESILNGRIVKIVGKDILEEKMTKIFIILCFYILLRYFILPVFEFGPWIHFLFTSSANVLRMLGYHVIVEPFYLVGDNGSIYMSKGCLGFKTMLLFASVVYLTGTSGTRRLVFIMGGLLFLNIVNIIRFVLLFMHVQKYGGYHLAIDLHELYKYVTYSLVFALWVLWFEKYSDLRKGQENNSE